MAKVLAREPSIRKGLRAIGWLKEKFIPDWYCRLQMAYRTFARVRSREIHGGLCFVWLYLPLLLSCGVVPIVVPTPGTIAPDFTLADLYDVEVNLSEFRGQVVLLLGCDKEGMNQKGQWLVLFKNRYAEQMQIFLLLDASGLPVFAKWFLKAKIKENLRGDVAVFPRILLDWDGKVSSLYGIRRGSCIAVLVDWLGRIRLIQPLGLIDKNAVGKTFCLIDEQLEP